MLSVKKLLYKVITYFNVVVPRVATFTESYTLQANIARTVTVSPSQLGLSGGIEPLMVSVTSQNARYNNWFMDNSEYVAGVGIAIRMYSSTATTQRVTVKLLYRQIAN